jgi:hypothetical protein
VIGGSVGGLLSALTSATLPAHPSTIDRIADFVAYDAYTWLAAARAGQQMGAPHPALRHQRLVREWMTGIGIAMGHA